MTLQTIKSEYPIINSLKSLPQEDIVKILSSLPQKYSDIIRLKFGIGVNGGKCYNFKEIGEILGLTADNNRAYPRQVLALSLGKLRNPMRYEKIEKNMNLEAYNG